ncbi:Sm-like protein LSM1B, partial [Cucurbita argyrosperma subsp. argyrosperma]
MIVSFYREVLTFAWRTNCFYVSANAVLEGSCERVIVGDLYSDIPLGLYVIRGENVVLLGELNMEKEELPPHMTHVSAVEIKRVSDVDSSIGFLK